MARKNDVSITVRVEPELLEAFRKVAQHAERSVNGQLTAYMRRSVALHNAKEAAQGRGKAPDEAAGHMLAFISSLLETGALSGRAIHACLWLAKHEDAAKRLLGLLPCGKEDCAAIIRSLRRAGLPEAAALAAYKQGLPGP